MTEHELDQEIKSIINSLDQIANQLAAGWKRIEAEADKMRRAASPGVQRQIRMWEDDKRSCRRCGNDCRCAEDYEIREWNRSR